MSLQATEEKLKETPGQDERHTVLAQLAKARLNDKWKRTELATHCREHGC
jgi:hypothetical protein